MLLTDESSRSTRAATRGVWALALAEIVSWGLIYYGFGVLLEPMAARANLTIAEAAGAFSLALLVAGLAAPLVGRAIDRRGPGAVMVVGSLLGAVGFVILSGADGAPRLYLAWAVLGLAHACTSYEPAFAAVMRWFDEADARRRALLVITSVGGFASTVFVPSCAFLVAAVGVERAALGLALLLAICVTPLHGIVALTSMPPVRSIDEESASRSAGRSDLVLLAFVFSLHAFASTGLSSFLFPSLIHRGIDAAEASLLAGLAGAAQVPARLAYGPIVRVVPRRARFVVLLTVQAFAIVGIGASDGVARIVAVLAYGATNGLATLERATVPVDWFGVRRYGANGGVLAAGGAFARAGAPLAVASIAGSASYAIAFGALGCALSLAAVLHAAAEMARAAREADSTA